MGDANFFQAISGPKPPPIGSFNRTGPLPPNSVFGSSGLFQPLSHINSSGSKLLGNVAPYSQNHTFSQEPSYLEIPHSITRIIPQIYVPSVDGKSLVRIAHPVQDGDIAWTMRDIPQEAQKHVSLASNHDCKGASMCAPILNISTVNYLLRGLVRYAHLDTTGVKQDDEGYQWVRLREALGANTFFPREAWKRRKIPSAPASHLLATDKNHTALVYGMMNCYMRLFQPLGVVHGSDKQGGQHQDGSIVTWPVDYVQNLVVDGRVQNMTNVWRHTAISAGDEMGFYLVPVEVNKSGHTKKMDKFTLMSKGSMGPMDFSSSEAQNDSFEKVFGITFQFFPYVEEERWEKEFYWHIASARYAFPKTPGVAKEQSVTDETLNTRGLLLDVTFAPAMFTRFKRVNWWANSYSNLLFKTHNHHGRARTRKVKSSHKRKHDIEKIGVKMQMLEFKEATMHEPVSKATPPPLAPPEPKDMPAAQDSKRPKYQQIRTSIRGSPAAETAETAAAPGNDAAETAAAPGNDAPDTDAVEQKKTSKAGARGRAEKTRKMSFDTGIEELSNILNGNTKRNAERPESAQ